MARGKKRKDQELAHNVMANDELQNGLVSVISKATMNCNHCGKEITIALVQEDEDDYVTKQVKKKSKRRVIPKSNIEDVGVEDDNDLVTHTVINKEETNNGENDEEYDEEYDENIDDLEELDGLEESDDEFDEEDFEDEEDSLDDKENFNEDEEDEDNFDDELENEQDEEEETLEEIINAIKDDPGIEEKIDRIAWWREVPRDKKYDPGDVIYNKESDRFGIFVLPAYKEGLARVKVFKIGTKNQLYSRDWFVGLDDLILVKRGSRVKRGFIETKKEFTKRAGKVV